MINITEIIDVNSDMTFETICMTEQKSGYGMDQLGLLVKKEAVLVVMPKEQSVLSNNQGPDISAKLHLKMELITKEDQTFIEIGKKYKVTIERV